MNQSIQSNRTRRYCVNFVILRFCQNLIERDEQEEQLKGSTPSKNCSSYICSIKFSDRLKRYKRLLKIYLQTEICEKLDFIYVKTAFQNIEPNPRCIRMVIVKVIFIDILNSFNYCYPLVTVLHCIEGSFSYEKFLFFASTFFN